MMHRCRNGGAQWARHSTFHKFLLKHPIAACEGSPEMCVPYFFKASYVSELKIRATQSFGVGLQTYT